MTGTRGRPPEVTFVSSNRGKAREVRSLLAEFGLRTRWARRSLVEVQSEELRQVAGAKLDQAGAGRGYVLVEDSGLFLTGLNGFPGVYSAFVYDTVGLDGVLRLLDGRTRRAVFRTVAGLRRGSRRWFFVGESWGTIARRPRGSRGFGYDPIFVPEATDRTYAEMSAEEKNSASHRAQAIRKVGAFVARRTGRRSRGGAP